MSEKLVVVDWRKIKVKNVSAIEKLINWYGSGNVRLTGDKRYVEVLREVKSKKVIKKAVQKFKENEKP